MIVLTGDVMFHSHECSTPNGISFLAILLLCAVLNGPACAAPETANVAAAVQDDSPASDGDQQFPSHTDRRENNSLFLWRSADNRDPDHVALLRPQASSKPKETLKPNLSWESGEGKSYVIPALEVPGFIVLLNAFDRLAFDHKVQDGKKVYHTTPTTIWKHFSRQNWHFDKDSFDVNQFGHPYEGATMYGLARSSGLNFWESFAYSHVGSFLWEMAGETTRPSFNDLITTGNAGSLLGEALFRMAGLVLEDGRGNPGRWHELAAAVISPTTGFNRFVFGERFDAVFPSHKPAAFWRLLAGAGAQTHATNLDPTDSSHDANLTADLAMAYGLPGKPGYTYRRPLDYFDLHLSTRTRIGSIIEAVMLRGLLVGTDYEIGSDYRGFWGMYGSYDYIAPRLYRVSSTAISLGTTGQRWVAPGVALQGSILGGLGFGATGTDTEAIDGRGYHYGATPQGLLALSMLFGDRTMLEFTGRGYYISSRSPDNTPGSEFVWRAQAGVSVRVMGNHAVGAHYVESIRDTNYNNHPNMHHSEGIVTLAYTFLSDTHFGAVEWRDRAGL